MNLLINMLTWWQWLLLGAIPPAIILLYFLKLKRQPLEVPSTFLWHRAIEDLRVNSIWQRLRQSLLLFLQLLLVALVILACLRPGMRGAKLAGNRFIFLVDTSASMGATDQPEQTTRLETAKRRIGELIDQMDSGDVAMIISFSDRAVTEQSFTNNRAELRRKLESIEQTQRSSALDEALRAASGLANPGRTSEAGNANDVQVADALPATLLIFSDGGFAAVPNFSLGHLTPKYVPVGQEAAPDNVGIVAFTTERNPAKPERVQAYGRLENYGPQDVTVDVAIFFNGQLRDASQVKVPQQASAGVQFDLAGDELELDEGTLRLEIQRADRLQVDNVAYATINSARLARVLLVTERNDPLRLALQTEQAAKIAAVSELQPGALSTKAYHEKADEGAYDLIIYDRCAPATMPQANTLFIGSLPPGDAWSRGELQGPLTVIDVEHAHPLMQLVEIGNVLMVEGYTVQPPPGGTSLIFTNIGTVLAIGPREGFEDAVLGLEIVGTDNEGHAVGNTNWPRRLSFPIFVQNVLNYLGGTRGSLGALSVQTGRVVTLHATAAVPEIQVTSPRGDRVTVPREGQNAFVFSRTDQPGVYDVREGRARQIAQRFSVNLFDSRESDLRVRPSITLGYEEVAAQSAWEPARTEAWKWLLLAGLAVLVLEWYVYNRRVYV